MAFHGKYLAFLAVILLSLSGTPMSLAQDSVKASDDIAVLVNPANSVTNVTLVELRRILSGEQRSWMNKLPVAIVMRSPGARERSVALGTVLHMTEREYKTYWYQKVFAGEAASEPLEIFSNGAQCEFVTARPGGVALVIGHDVRLSLKVLKIDGKLPGEPGYPLN